MAIPLQFILENVLRYTLMGKHKKKHSKKDDVSEDILDAAALSVKKFRKVTKEIGKLSTGQKIVGGLALVAAGLVYLAAETDGPAPAADNAAAGAKSSDDDAEETIETADAPARPSTSRKPRKSSKAKFSAEHD